jgi:hypothetical protein
VKIIVYERLSTQAKALFWAGLWAAIYLLLIFVLPTNTSTMKEYDLSAGEYRVLTLLTGLPMIMVWFTAFFGYGTLAAYAEKIQGTREGVSYRAVARGLKWLAWALAAFTYMSNGSRSLREVVNKLPSKQVIRGMIAASIIISVAFCTITIDTVQNIHPNPYRLPLWLILLTIIIPYLYAWLMGFFAVFEMSEYRRMVRGVFYRRALRLLAAGTTCVIIASVILQYMTSSSRYLRRIQLGWPMLIMYTTLIVFAVGFILIAVGTNKLKKLEEV